MVSAKNDILKRAGRFAISDTIIRDPLKWQRIMSQILVIHCVHFFWENIFVYDALSHIFDIADENERPPYYLLEGDPLRAKQTNVLETSLL